MADLSIELFKKRLRNPVMNASGTLGYSNEIEALWKIDTLGAYVTKGLSLKPHHGNPPPRVWDERHGMINSIGLQNVGIDRFFEKHFPFFRQRKTPIIINFFGFTEEEYVAFAEKVKPDKCIVALEMNLSCPNIKAGGISFGKEPQTVFEIVKKVKAVTPLPLIAKLTPEVKNIVEIGSAAFEAGADGLTLINTMPAAIVDIQRKNVPLKGGFSGPALKPIALRAVYECSRAIPIPVIGVGGIMNADDAISFFMAGARAIQIGSATFVDPYTIPKVIAEINRYLDRCGQKTLREITGTTHG